MKIWQRIIILLVVAVFVSTAPITAQTKGETATRFVRNVSGTGTTAAAFLQIGVDARAMAMGGAYASIATDASALYWNPAGTAWVPRMEASFTHSDWLADTNYDFLGMVVPIYALNSAIGLSFYSLGYDDQPVRTIEQPNGTGEFYGARDISIGISYALSLTDRFAFGLSTKYIQQRIWSESGAAFGMDIGIFYHTLLKGLQIGAAMSNFGSELSLHGRDLRTIKDPDETISNYDRVPVDYTTSSFPLPLLFRFGISYQTKFASFNSIVLSADVQHPNNRTESINLGMEYGIGDMFFFRAGYQNLFERDSINGLTAGAGVVYSIRGSMKFRLDYSWSDWDFLQNAQRFTLAVSF